MDSSKNKAKIAKRLIEVLEFFADAQRAATVTDIVRHFQRPQSSTSELLKCLVGAGVLYQEPLSRTYLPTPRLAAMGSACQPEPIANGSLFSAMDELAANSDFAVGLIGIVGTDAQVFRWATGGSSIPGVLGIGHAVPLFSCPSGLLLLSKFELAVAGQILWRTLAEAEAHARFSLSDLKRQVECFGILGHATGDYRSIPGHKITAVLLPSVFGVRPLALSAVYDAGLGINCDDVVASLRSAISRSSGSDGPSSPAALLMTKFDQQEGSSAMLAG